MQSKRTLTGNSSRVCFDISRASSVGIMYPVRCTFQTCPVYNSPLVQKASKPEAQRSKTTAHNTLLALLKRLLPTPSAPLPRNRAGVAWEPGLSPPSCEPGPFRYHLGYLAEPSCTQMLCLGCRSTSWAHSRAAFSPSSEPRRGERPSPLAMSLESGGLGHKWGAAEEPPALARSPEHGTPRWKRGHCPCLHVVRTFCLLHI